MKDETVQPAQGQTEARQVWQRPEIVRIMAGDAEFGATPLVPEGAFGSGS